MLNKDQIELIQHEIDEANTPAQSAAFRALVAANPEARVLAAELGEVASTFERVAERAPPPYLKQAILRAVQTPHVERPQSINRWFAVLLQRMEESVMTKKAILIGASAVAIVIVGAYFVTGYPRLGGVAGTIGDSISGVQPAVRYHGRALTQGDITLDNPQIAVLFQNHDVLALVKSDAFRELMKNDAFRGLQRNDAFRSILATDAFRNILHSDAYRELMKNDAYRAVMKGDASRELQSNAAFRELQNNASFKALEANQTFHAMQSDASFQSLMANDAFRAVMANDAMRVLQASEAFRAVARDPQLSEAFLSEANRFLQ